MTEGLRVVMVDDHAGFRDGLRFVLEQSDDVAVVGEAPDGRTALDVVVRLAPDVVLMDLAMPVMDGLTATRELAQRGCRSRVVVLTLSEDDSNVFLAMRAGATGYLVKGTGPEQVLAAVRAAAAGHAVFGPALATRMLSFFERGRRRDQEVEALSSREREVLDLVARGLTNQEIAASLVISPITARNHVSNILTKLQMSSRREAILRFPPQDWSPPGPT